MVVSGFPATREAAEVWNQLQVHARVVIPRRALPPATNVLLDLNGMRALERVIVETDDPSHRGATSVCSGRSAFGSCAIEGAKKAPEGATPPGAEWSSRVLQAR